VLTRSTSLAGLAFFLASSASAASPDVNTCRAIADATQRLACYDRVAAGDAAPAENMAHAAPAATPAAPPPAPPVRESRAAAPSRDEAKTVRSGRIAAVRPLRHGYFRLELENGPAYETTEVAAPPPVGSEVRIRGTLFGTTFFDIKGWSPIAVRLARVQ